MTLPYTRALVTGATGIVGSHLCHALAEQGVVVYATGLQEPAAAAALPATATFQAGDITDATFVDQLFKAATPEVVFHLAAYGTFGHEKDVQQMIRVNIGGTTQLLQAAVAHNCRAFIQAGSIKEYPTGRTPITEEQPIKPWDEYAATKMAAQLFGQLVATKHLLPVTTLRLSPVYGPGDAPSRFIISAIKAVLEDTHFTISVGSLVRNFTYVDDVVQAFLLASSRMEAGYDDFNIGDTQAHAFMDIIRAIEQATGKALQKIEVKATTATDDSWVVDSSKAQRVLGWRPTVSLEEGIKRTVAWYREQPASTLTP